MSLLNAFRQAATISTGQLGRDVRIEPLGGTPSTVSAVVYRERTEWRTTDQGRERVIVRDVVVSHDDASVPLGSVFEVDNGRYAVERTTGSASGRRRLTGRRVAHAEVTRPNYRGRQ